MIIVCGSWKYDYEICHWNPVFLDRYNVENYEIKTIYFSDLPAITL